MALPDKHMLHLERLAKELGVRTHHQDPQYLGEQSLASAIRWLIEMDLRSRTNNTTGWRHYLSTDPISGNVVVEWENVYDDEHLVEGFDNTRPLSDGPVSKMGKRATRVRRPRPGR